MRSQIVSALSAMMLIQAAAPAAAAYQYLRILGNRVLLSPVGANAPLAIDATLLPSAAVGEQSQNSFVVENDSTTASVSITDITFTGTHADQFSLDGSAVINVPANGATNFIVEFSPTSAGIKSCQVNVASNDPMNPTYSFDIAGIAFATPAELTPPVDLSPEFVSSKSAFKVNKKTGLYDLKSKIYIFNSQPGESEGGTLTLFVSEKGFYYPGNPDFTLVLAQIPFKSVKGFKNGKQGLRKVRIRQKDLPSSIDNYETYGLLLTNGIANERKRSDNHALMSVIITQ